MAGTNKSAKRKENNGSEQSIANKVKMPPDPAKSRINLDAAQKAIAAEQKARGQKCTQELAAILEKYGCDLQAVTVIQNNQIMQSVEVVVLTPEQIEQRKQQQRH